MIKRTLYFGNPAYLSLKLEQLSVKLVSEDSVKTVPVEDIGVIVLDNPQITMSNALMEKLVENNCAVITCNSKHMPSGMLLALQSNTVQNERYRDQLDASLPLQKQLWQQTIQQKIRNQAVVLSSVIGDDAKCMFVWADSVKSGDSENVEARAAAYYWKNVFPHIDCFTREREGDAPNCFLNYGYAILRGVVARALVATGLLPTLGIHHHNRYNAYCLADDIMEPYRPYVDQLVIEIVKEFDSKELTKEIKIKLLEIPVLDVLIDGKRSPLMTAVSVTTASLYKCFARESRKILYPEME
ncbi:CRISP-associated protein Cas1 [Fibrobacter sp. UWH9]|uniref:type II CRISPR-associated endonuclease Cas1 n=1 Tax=Fibrobacter sp. UWH9 TaxID=1896213 RepID=UPI000923F3DC|nr:type II CRISPR-associated endonuclease Cas1 [Fibrobacter sp. UWH9]SHH56299.1 CRISP-associated protein Cas1 [Fibrobacter sp. UWH9]